MAHGELGIDIRFNKETVGIDTEREVQRDIGAQLAQSPYTDDIGQRGESRNQRITRHVEVDDPGQRFRQLNIKDNAGLKT